MSIEGNTARYVDLSESGLLWLINTAVLHPRGYALAVNTATPVNLLLLGDGTEPVTFADSMHETVRAKFAAVEALLAPHEATALTGDGTPRNVSSLPPTPGVEHHEGHLELSGEGAAFEADPQFRTVEGESVTFNPEIVEGIEPAEGTAEGGLEHPEDAVDLPVEEEK